MGGTIYLIGRDDQLVPMTEQPYDTEALLQGLLAKYPSLLAGEQMDPTAPREWLLVRREAGIPIADGAGAHWWVDHLFLDQDAIPTLVEVKCSDDPRIRREVVGQMLDYAANAVVYFPIERIRAAFEERCAAAGENAELQIRRLRPELDSVDRFWSDVKTNLQAGKIRLVFVANEIPTSLQRVVEFLNEQMDPAEVLAVEVRQFVGAGHKSLVPRLLGQTAQAQQKKSSSSPRGKWDEARFFADLATRRGQGTVEVMRRLLEWSRERGLSIWWGEGGKDGSFFPEVPAADGDDGHFTFSAWTYGRIEIQFQHMVGRRPYGDESRRKELLARLNGVRGLTVPADGLGRRPSFQADVLTDPVALASFLAVWDWYLAEVRRSR